MSTTTHSEAADLPASPIFDSLSTVEGRGPASTSTWSSSKIQQRILYYLCESQIRMHLAGR
ncbi:hypothetical protein [Streptomyces smyrnaeus]|uniref:hypothetical protein n=1 Tax=Streptomyces smyrnaeus TaxID=1387713 RepID=UPI003406F82D